MDVHQASLFLLRCAGVNFALLLLGFAMWAAAGGRMHAAYGRVFRVDRARFDAVVLALLGTYKLGIVLMLLVPGLVLRLQSAI